MSDHGHGGGGGHAPKASGGHGGGGGGGAGGGKGPVSEQTGFLIFFGAPVALTAFWYLQDHPDIVAFLILIGLNVAFLIIPFWIFRALWTLPPKEWLGKILARLMACVPAALCLGILWLELAVFTASYDKHELFYRSHLLWTGFVAVGIWFLANVVEAMWENWYVKKHPGTGWVEVHAHAPHPKHDEKHEDEEEHEDSADHATHAHP